MKKTDNILSSDYREWWKNKKIYVFGTEGVKPDNVRNTIGIICDIIKEFNLPLCILNRNEAKSKDIFVIKILIINNTQQNLIDCESMEKELIHFWKEDLLPYGLIVLVNPKKYEFKPLEHGDRAIYGYGTPKGLIILRGFDINNAVRHEFGHMIGLGSHHNNCVMHYSCSIEKFCDRCREKIENIWG